MINLINSECPSIENLEPTYKTENIAIVFETSQLFVPYLSVALLSLLQYTSPQYNYDILILSCELQEHDEIALHNIIQGKDNITMRFLNPHLIAKKYIDKARFSYLEINYYRLLLPWILQNYDKVINLGADIIIQRDIAELYEIRLSDDEFMAGAPDLGYHGRLAIDISPKELGKKDPFTYVNADVILLNLRAIRQSFTQDQIMRIWQKKQLRCAEQDAMNIAFDGHVKMLDLRWNVYPQRMNSEYHIEHAPEKSVEIWKESLSDPYLIHYAAIPKPWDYPLVGFGHIWWEYARQSIYYEEMLRRMCMTACNANGGQVIGVKGALVNYFRKHCPAFLRPFAKKIKKLLKW